MEKDKIYFPKDAQLLIDKYKINSIGDDCTEFVISKEIEYLLDITNNPEARQMLQRMDTIYTCGYRAVEEENFEDAMDLFDLVW